MTDELSGEEIKDQAWEIVQDYFKKNREAEVENYRIAVAQGLATDDLKEAVLASYDGRVSTLFVKVGYQQWGKLDAENRELAICDENVSGAEDMLDFAAIKTLKNSGKVYGLAQDEMPGNTRIAAILRY